MKLVDMLADILENPPQEGFVDNMIRMHEPEIEDLFHGLVNWMHVNEAGYELALVASLDLMLYALRRHGMPEDFQSIFEVE